jgi:uncharacterized protein YjiS (DUF1127 family)
MEFPAKLSSFHAHGISNASFRRRVWVHGVRAALAALGHAIAEFRRTRRDHEYQLRMSESELRDIGLHRVETVVGRHIVPLRDARW